jgi:hypothetical protein
MPQMDQTLSAGDTVIVKNLSGLPATSAIKT